MMVQSKIQINQKEYEFIKKIYKELKYKSLSEYMRDAINAKVKQDRKKLRRLERLKAMEGIGKNQYEDLFESIGGEEFEDR